MLIGTYQRLRDSALSQALTLYYDNLWIQISWPSDYWQTFDLPGRSVHLAYISKKEVSIHPDHTDESGDESKNVADRNDDNDVASQQTNPFRP